MGESRDVCEIFPGARKRTLDGRQQDSAICRQFGHAIHASGGQAEDRGTMKMQNVGTTDAFMRIAMGLTMLAAGTRRGFLSGSALVLFGASQVATGITRYCPILEGLGRNTLEGPEASNGHQGGRLVEGSRALADAAADAHSGPQADQTGQAAFAGRYGATHGAGFGMEAAEEPAPGGEAGAFARPRRRRLRRNEG